MCPDHPAQSYKLDLGDGLRWKLTGTRETRTWLAKFASILNLGHCHSNDLPNLIFVARPGDENGYATSIRQMPNLAELHMPANEWSMEDHRAVRIWTNPHSEDVILELSHQGESDHEIAMMGQTLYAVYGKLTDIGGLSLHAALAELHGAGVLLVGASGSGKSTCSRRFPRPWNSLCDDEALAIPQGSVTNKGYVAVPFPTWSDYWEGRFMNTYDSGARVPLSALFFLKPAKADKVSPLGQGEAAMRITHSASQICAFQWQNLSSEAQRTARRRIFRNACAMAGALPAFVLHTSLKGRFWAHIEEMIRFTG
ncbi:MAG TPA: SynChlorMet cassette protein ScmC [Desulfomonilaceae bacterium]|nr:SynChlorMet cassette protein ScmC [Desulfomonilaceae bacterium]